MSSLTPSSYIVLGLIADGGAMTSYDLKAFADKSIGYFWPFSRAQLYKEPARLADLGLLAETQEESGRRRRQYSLTKAGRAALKDWLSEPTQGSTEIRDQALLKLFFLNHGAKENLDQLIASQIDAHMARLKDYEEIRAQIQGTPEWVFNQAALEMGLRFERMAIRYWSDMKKEPPGRAGAG